jgi:hypothetical protein
MLASIVIPANARRSVLDIDSLLLGSSLTSECLVEALRRRPGIAFLFAVLGGPPGRHSCGNGSGNARSWMWQRCPIAPSLSSRCSGVRKIAMWCWSRRRNPLGKRRAEPAEEGALRAGCIHPRLLGYRFILPRVVENTRLLFLRFRSARLYFVLGELIGLRAGHALPGQPKYRLTRPRAALSVSPINSKLRPERDA